MRLLANLIALAAAGLLLVERSFDLKRAARLTNPQGRSTLADTVADTRFDMSSTALFTEASYL